MRELLMLLTLAVTGGWELLEISLGMADSTKDLLLLALARPWQLAC